MDFIANTTYWFVGPLDMVENKINSEYSEKDKVFLGKFIEHIGFLCGSDWLYNAKARFEYGTISCGHYDKIHT
jgi:hypothetical protein